MAQSQFSGGNFGNTGGGGSRGTNISSNSYGQGSQAIMPDPGKVGGSLPVNPLNPNQMMTPVSDNDLMTPLSANQMQTQLLASQMQTPISDNQITSQAPIAIQPQSQTPQAQFPQTTAPVMSEDVFGMFMQGQIIGNADQMQKARRRKMQIDMLTTNDPSTVGAMIASGKESLSSQKMIDLKNYAPEFYAEVQRAVKGFTATESINEMGDKIYKNLNSGDSGRETDISIDDTAGASDMDVAMADDPMKKINDDTLAYIQENFGDSAADYYELSSRLLTNNPAIQAALQGYTSASAERKKIQRQIENVGEETRKLLGSDVPESFVGSYIARQTRDLTKQLNAAIDVENTELQNLQTLRNNAIQQLEMIQAGQLQDIQAKQNSFENQLALAKMQQSASTNRQWNDDLQQYYRTSNGQLETSSTLPSGPQGALGASSFRQNALSNITRTDPNAPDMDISMSRLSAIYSPFEGTITKAETQANGNVQIQMKTVDGYTLTFNHLDPSSLEGVQVGSTIGAGQVLGKAGNTGMVKSFVNGQRVTLRDENGNVPEMTLANGMTPAQMLAQGSGSHVDIRAIGPNGERLTNSQIQQLFTQNAADTRESDLEPLYTKFLSKEKSLTTADYKFIESLGVDEREFTKQARAYQQNIDRQMTEHAQTLLGLIEQLKNVNKGTFQLMRGNVPGTVGRDYRNIHNRVLSSTALQELIDLKAQGATFGALSDNELSFITNAATDLRVRSTYGRYMEILGEMERSLRKGIEGSTASATGGSGRSWDN